MANTPVSTDRGTWYLQARKFFNIEHHLLSRFEKSIIEKTIHYIKYRTEGFDDYFPCRKQRYKLNHVKQWINKFAYNITKRLYQLYRAL